MSDSAWTLFIALFCLACKHVDSACPEYQFTEQATQSCTSCAAVGGHRLRCLVWNSSICETCPAGKYSVLNGTINTCVPCPRGTFSNTMGSVACTPCPDLTHAIVAGSTSCLPCEKCPTMGEFRSGCSATSSGTCSQCTNTPSV
jgi:hypothetical protein